MNARILNIPSDMTIYNVFCFLKHRFPPCQCSFFQSTREFLPSGLRAGISVHCCQCGASSQGDGRAGADQPAASPRSLPLGEQKSHAFPRPQGRVWRTLTFLEGGQGQVPPERG